MDVVRPVLDLTSVTIASPDPRRLAEFYSDLLGAAITTSEPARPGKPAEDGWAQLRTDRITLNFEYEECWVTPVWPARAGMQTATQHLDIRVHDLAAAVDWAVRCGAQEAADRPQAGVRVMRDPQGHPFCLFA